MTDLKETVVFVNERADCSAQVCMLHSL